MKIARIVGVTALVVLAVGQAKAAEVTGGELRFGHERFLDDVPTGSGEDTASRTSLEASMELALSYASALQFDLGLDRAGIFDETGTSGAIHGLYRFGSGQGGVFAGLDSIGDTDLTFYGIEGALQLDRVRGEAYVMGTSGDIEGTVYGLRGGYLANADWTVGGRLEHGNFDGGIDAARYGLTADLQVTPGTTISAELGHAKSSVAGVGSASDQYVGVQATFSFGAENGTAFGRRGILDLLPGF